jgi:hypothetical protein
MTKRNEREQRRSKYASAGKRAELKRSGESTACVVPDGMKLFGIKKDGMYRLDILPYVAGPGNAWAEPGQLYYERTFYTHRAVGPSEETVVCPAKTWNQRCPICEFAARLRHNPNHDKELYKNLRAKERQLFLIRDRDHMDDGPQLWDISNWNFGKLLDSRIRKKRSALEAFFHSEEGHPGMYLEVAFEEANMGSNKYYKAESIDFIPRRNPLKESLLRKLPCLDKLPVALKYDALKKLFLQTAPSGDEDESGEESHDEDDEPDNGGARAHAAGEDEEQEDDRRPHRRHRDDDEDAEAPFDDDEPVGDDDEDEPRSRRRDRDGEDEEQRPRRRRRRARDDDDGEQDDELEEATVQEDEDDR